MTWETASEALLTQLETVAGLDGHVTIDDMRVLNGGTAKAAVVEYRGFRQERRSFQGDNVVIWTPRVGIWARYISDAQVREALRDMRDGILSRLDAYSHLGSEPGIFDAFVVSGERQPEDVEVGGVRYIGEALLLEIADEYAVAPLD